MANIKVSKAICQGGIIEHGTGEARTSHTGQNGEHYSISNTTNATYRNQIAASFANNFGGATNYEVTMVPTSYFGGIWIQNSANENA